MIITVTLNPAIDKMYWIDRLKMGQVTQEEFLTRAIRSDIAAGGKGINISIFLSRLGVENIAMGFVGGHTGHVVVRDLRDEGVTTNFVWVNGETRTNVTILEKGREHIPVLIDEEGRSVSQEEIARFLRRYKRMLYRATWVVLAGSLPPGVDADIYRVLAELATEAGVKVVVSARGNALTRALRAAPYLVKPDTREHLSMEGTALTTRSKIIAVGKKVVETGVGILITSHEVTGDIAITKDGIWEIKSPVKTTEFKNLVGADDALLGGILYMLDKGEKIEEALRFGMAAGIRSAESYEKICRDLDKITVEMENVSLERL
ncbi:MAG: 1-phosphofructokinase family hexose kinase [Candidatus Bipolaricaulota bacterium]|nr:1-phosphofructokinase family hexose kinase [Candidatus Bipolaricaulota bacterium]